MSDRRTRVLLFAVFFCLAVSLGAQVASAAQYGPILTSVGPTGR